MSEDIQLTVKNEGSVGAGLGLTALLHLINIVFPPAFLFIGVSQLVYMIPAVIIAYKKGYKVTAKWMMIGAAITFLLNATCFGIILASLGKH